MYCVSLVFNYSSARSLCSPPDKLPSATTAHRERERERLTEKEREILTDTEREKSEIKRGRDRQRVKGGKEKE